jgi:hypothetical protein
VGVCVCVCVCVRARTRTHVCVLARLDSCACVHAGPYVPMCAGVPPLTYAS